MERGPLIWLGKKRPKMTRMRLFRHRHEAGAWQATLAEDLRSLTMRLNGKSKVDDGYEGVRETRTVGCEIMPDLQCTQYKD